MTGPFKSRDERLAATLIVSSVVRVLPQQCANVILGPAARLPAVSAGIVEGQEQLEALAVRRPKGVDKLRGIWRFAMGNVEDEGVNFGLLSQVYLCLPLRLAPAVRVTNLF